MASRLDAACALALVALTTSCAAEAGDDADETSSGVTRPALNVPTCRGKQQCTTSPSGRANFYRVGQKYQVDISGMTTGREDNGMPTAAFQSIGALSETARWVLDEAKRRNVPTSRIALRGHSLGGIDAMVIAARVRVSRAVVFGVPSQAVLRFSNELSLYNTEENVPVVIIQGERDPAVIGTSLIDEHLDPRIRLRWVPSPFPDGTNAANHLRDAYCRFAPETCFS